MKRAGIALLVAMPVLAWGKPNPADYTVAVHVQSSQLVTACIGIGDHAFCGIKQHLQVVVGGRKLELNSKSEGDAVLRTGDYKAKVLIDDQTDVGDPAPAYEIRFSDTYEFLFPDGKTRKYSVVGESE